MIPYNRTENKKVRVSHTNVEGYVEHLNGCNKEELQPLIDFMGIDFPVKFESQTGGESDFKGIDFLAIGSETKSVQDKLRQRDTGSGNKAGKDIGIEALRFYGFKHNDKFRVVYDFGRDLYQIPPTAIPVEIDGDRYHYHRDLKTTECESDFYVVHPVGEPFAFWAKSNFVKGVAKIFAMTLLRAIREEDERLTQAVKNTFRFSGGGDVINIKYQIKDRMPQSRVPRGIDLWVRSDVDKKDVVVEGQTISAKVSKMNVYIDPRTGVIGQPGNNFICY